MKQKSWLWRATRRFAYLGHIDYVKTEKIARAVARRETDVLLGAPP